MTATTGANADEAQRLRDAMTDKLVKLGSVTSPQIEAAFRAVPRHAFARPGTSLEECYRGDIVRNKKDAGGVTLSSISGVWLQARMIAQLADSGTLVVPLRMNGVTRSIAFRKNGSHLASTSAVTCGFVPMQGIGGQPETFFQVPAPDGGHITLRYENDVPAEPPLPSDILASEPVTAWSGLTIADMTPWSDIYLWLAVFAPGFCRLDQAGDPHLAGGGPVMKTGWYPFAIARSGTLSYLTVRDLPDGSGVEFGTVAYGHRTAQAAATLISHLRAWDARGRDLPQDAFTYWPDGATPPIPDRLLSVFPRRQGTATITWPAERVGDED